MTAKLSVAEIRSFWEKQAKIYGQSPAASWSDFPVIDMEISEIVRRLDHGDKVLDIGCANGYSTIQFATHRRVDVQGLDYVPEMIEHARTRLEAFRPRLAGSAAFDVGDVMGLAEPDGAYDKVIVVRVVINLGEWDRQLRGLREAARVVKPGGMLLLSEATLQGWNRLNEFRREWSLPDIPMPSFNSYLDEEAVISALSPGMELLELVNFASTYFVGTRVLKPLLAKALGSAVDVARPDMEWNRWLSQAPSWGDYGTQKLFVFRKRPG